MAAVAISTWLSVGISPCFLARVITSDLHARLHTPEAPTTPFRVCGMRHRSRFGHSMTLKRDGNLRRREAAMLAVGMLGISGFLLSPRRSVAGDLAIEESALAAIRSIELECQPMIHAVRRSGGAMLYRGATERTSIQSNLPLIEESDLLDQKTYGANGADFFGRLEGWLSAKKSVALASNGHIGVGNATEAGLWGTSCSCWPTGDFHYFWLENSRLIFDENWTDGELAREDERLHGAHLAPFWKDATALDKFLSNGARLDCEIENALHMQHEVLFSCPQGQGYWLIPAEYDAMLRTGLKLE